MTKPDMVFEHARNATQFMESIDLDKCDPELGWKVHDHLVKLDLENPRSGTYDPQKAMAAIDAGMFDGLARLGINMKDPSMADTSKRYAKMLVGELTKGLNYDFFPKCTATPAGPLKDMVLVRNIEVMSLCEHHLQTIDGFAHIAYVPDQQLLGLSKLARVTDFFCRRPQVQERLTAQIAAALQYVLGCDDVGVIVNAKHYCMKARGSNQHHSDTQTDAMRGKFFTNHALRKEMFDAIRG